MIPLASRPPADRGKWPMRAMDGAMTPGHYGAMELFGEKITAGTIVEAVIVVAIVLTAALASPVMARP